MQGLAYQSIFIMAYRKMSRRRGRRSFGSRRRGGRRRGGYRKSSRSYYVSRGGIRL